VSQNESAGEFAEKGDKRRVLGEGIKGGRLSRDQGRVQASDFPFSSASILTALPKKDFSSHPRRPHKFLLRCDFLPRTQKIEKKIEKKKKNFFCFCFCVCLCGVTAVVWRVKCGCGGRGNDGGRAEEEGWFSLSFCFVSTRSI
jgi:hypothetical protein